MLVRENNTPQYEYNLKNPGEKGDHGKHSVYSIQLHFLSPDYPASLSLTWLSSFTFSHLTIQLSFLSPDYPASLSLTWLSSFTFSHLTIQTNSEEHQEEYQRPELWGGQRGEGRGVGDKH